MARRPQQKRATQKDDKKDSPNKQRLELEIKERKWNVSFWGRASKLAPLISVLAIGVGLLQWYWQMEQWRQETITNLKREFASDNPAIRIGAAYALAEYPKEAIHIFIESLKEENTVLTDAVKISLKQIGKDAVTPLTEELRNIQGEEHAYSQNQCKKKSNN